ncbi:MAG: GspH/FimT family pseudopilin [Rhodocyclales bacterium]|jgi:type IV fimbrial biogenesis protein FimT|nr:GspH/FimT family pseudopilin [Rhodocyclales bacterium]
MKRQRGFSLIEMVVVVVIMGILLGLGLPSYRTYMANQRIVASAEVFMTGLQMARAEAVKLNQRVEFILTDVDPTPASVDTTSTSTAGRNWIVRALAAGGNAFIEGKSGAEGSGSATGAGSPVVLTGSLAAVTFDGFGMPVGLATTATFDFSNPSAGSCAPAGPVRCLQVRLSRGGQARLCDPATPVGDTRSCGI